MSLINTYTLDLDLKNNNYISEPVVTSNDSIRFVINITDDGLPLELTSVTVVSITHTRSDGVIVLKSGTKSGDNQVSFDFGTTETLVAGRVDCKVQLYDASNRVSTILFRYTVTKDPSGSDYIPSEDEKTLIEVILVDGLQILADAQDATIQANIATANTNALRVIVEGNEVERVANEVERKSSETTRKTNESARVTAETGRVNVESSRVTAETARKTAETGRANVEALRVTAETARATEEGNRVTAETARKTAETGRANVEALRVTAETGRVNAEGLRSDAETIRKNNETARVNAESSRVTVEAARVTAETTRATNETARVNKEAARVTAETARVGAESSRVTVETARVNAESTRDTQENTRKTNETARGTAEAARVTAETTRAANETSRNTAEDLRNDNESLRITKEADRVTAETARVGAESSRVTVETARVNAESTRNTQENTRKTNETTRQTQETARQTNSQTAVTNANTATVNMNTLIAQTKGFGNYNAATSYKPNNFVTYNGSSWMALVNVTGVTPAVGASQWQLVAQRGVDGTGSVVTVNSKSPDLNGNIALTASDVGVPSNIAISDGVLQTDLNAQLHNGWYIYKNQSEITTDTLTGLQHLINNMNAPSMAILEVTNANRTGYNLAIGDIGTMVVTKLSTLRITAMFKNGNGSIKHAVISTTGVFSSWVKDVLYDSSGNISEVGNLASLSTTAKGNAVAAINELFQSVSDGKGIVAAAIAGKDQPTAADATFQVMANNISAIVQGSGNAQPSDVLADKTFSNDSGASVGSIPVAVSDYGEVKVATSYVAPPGMRELLVGITPNQYMKDISWITAFDHSFTPSNIAKGTAIFGLYGTFTEDANATATQILAGSTAYVNGFKVLGAMVNRTTGDYTAGTVTRAGTMVGFSPDVSGYYGTSSRIGVTEPDLVAANIIKGKSIFGLQGSLDVPTCYKESWLRRHTSINSASTLQAIAFGKERFVSSGSGNEVTTSSDGIQWNVSPMGLSTAYVIRALESMNDIFIAAGVGGTLATSSDGTSWIQRTSSFGTKTILGLAFGHGSYVAVGETGMIATSDNSYNWTQRTSGLSGMTTINSVCFGKDIFVAAGSGGQLITSTNGISWTQRTSGFGSSAINAVCFNNGIFVAVGASGKVATSLDGISWTLKTGWGLSNAIQGICSGNGMFVAVGASGRIARSVDCISWTHLNHSFSNSSIMDVTFANGMFIAVGDNGKVESLGSMLEG